MKKILWRVVIGLVVLLVAAVVVVALFLDNIVKKGVETIGPQITRVSINLDEVHLSLLTGSAKIKGLVVGNPEGYKTSEAIRVGTASVGVDPFSIFSDKIVARTIRVESPEITFEGGLGGNNLSKIMDNVNSTAKTPGPVSTNATGQVKPAKKYEVDDFLITGAKVHVSLTGTTGREMTLPLPEIHLTDLGKNSDGITATELTRRVLGAINSATIKTVANAATDLGKNAETLEEAGQNTGKKITKSIGGLLGK